MVVVQENIVGGLHCMVKERDMDMEVDAEGCLSSDWGDIDLVRGSPLDSDMVVDTPEEMGEDVYNSLEQSLDPVGNLEE